MVSPDSLRNKASPNKVGISAGSDFLIREWPVIFKMKRIVLCSVLSIFVSCSSPVQVGQEAPAFALDDLQGKPITLSELRGKVVLLHFWATWCPPCLVELPQLFKFSKGLDQNHFKLLAISVDDTSPEKIRKFLGSWGYDVPVYHDPGGKLAGRYGTYRYPETYILDHQGVVQKKIIGAADWNDSTWAQFLLKMASDLTK